MEILSELPNPLQFNVLKHLQHLTAALVRGPFDEYDMFKEAGELRDPNMEFAEYALPNQLDRCCDCCGKSGMSARAGVTSAVSYITRAATVASAMVMSQTTIAIVAMRYGMNAHVGVGGVVIIMLCAVMNVSRMMDESRLSVCCVLFCVPRRCSRRLVRQPKPGAFMI